MLISVHVNNCRIEDPQANSRSGPGQHMHACRAQAQAKEASGMGQKPEAGMPTRAQGNMLRIKGFEAGIMHTLLMTTSMCRVAISPTTRHSAVCAYCGTQPSIQSSLAQ